MSIFKNIKGFTASSLVDWDGKVSSVIFLGGCNFKCSYCSNKELVISPEKIKSIDFKDIKKTLDKNMDFVDGIVITGGEPTIYSDLPDLCQEIKNLGFKVKLDTNGSNPEMLQDLLDKKLVDSAAMDIKTSFGKYRKVAGCEVDLEKIKKSIEIISKFPEYEFRSTVFPDISREDLAEIADYLKEKNASQAFFIHQFRNDSCLDEKYEKIKPYSKEELEDFLNLIKNKFEKSGIRN